MSEHEEQLPRLTAEDRRANPGASDVPGAEHPLPQPAASGAFGLMLLTGLLLLVCMGALAVVVVEWRMAPLREALGQRPPIVVLDFDRELAGLDPETASDGLRRLLGEARRLGERGVLVLDDKAVLAAPAGLNYQAVPR